MSLPQPQAPHQGSYTSVHTPSHPRPSAFAGLPGTVLTAAILWGLAGLIAVAGPIGALVEYNQTVAAMNRAYSDLDPMSGNFTGGLNSFMGQANAPLHGLLIFGGVVGLAGYVVVSIFVLRGSQVARIIATVLSGLSIFALVAMFALGIPPLFQFLLSVAGGVLVWLPSSSAYFAAKQAAKPRPVPYSQFQQGQPGGPVA